MSFGRSTQGHGADRRPGTLAATHNGVASRHGARAEKPPHPELPLRERSSRTRAPYAAAQGLAVTPWSKMLRITVYATTVAMIAITGTDEPRGYVMQWMTRRLRRGEATSI